MNRIKLAVAMTKQRRSREREWLHASSKIGIMFALFVLLTPAWVRCGRGDKSGTAGASELLIPVGARAAALAGASLASVSGIEAIFWNPAGLARSMHTNAAMFSHSSYIADIGVDYLALSTGLSEDVYVGISLKSLSIGEINVTTEDQPDGTGEITSPSFFMLGGTFARRISDRITVGLTSTYVFEKMANVSASTFAFSGGVQYAGLGGVEGLGVGVAVKNLGPKLKYDGAGLERTVDVNDALRPNAVLKLEAASSELPSTIEIGLGYSMVMPDLGGLDFESSFINNNFSDDEYKIGVEYAYDSRLFLRGGYAFSSVDVGLQYIFGFCGGIGFRTTFNNVELTMNYAYRSLRYFSGSHLLDVILGF